MAAGALPQTPLGELTALPVPLAGLKGPTSKGRGGGRVGGGEGKEGKEKGGRGREGRERGREGEGKEGREREGPPKLLLNQGPSQPCYATAYDAF